MEYEILDEKILGEIKEQFETRSIDWTEEQTSNALKNYTVELENLRSTINLQRIGLRLYKEDASINRPVFAYEASIEYAEALREQKLPEMEASLNENVGKYESTHYQIGLMADKLASFKLTEE